MDKVKKYIGGILSGTLLGLSQVCAQEKVVSLTAAERAPYVGESIAEQGYLTEITKAAFEKQGYTVKLTFFPLIRASKALEEKEGKYDGLL